MLDDHHRIARIDQLVQHFEQLAHIVEMQARRRLVENVQRATRRPLGQFLGQLHPLRLAARQGRRLLADFHIAEADLHQRLHLG